MSWHPLLLAVIIIDVIVLLFLSAAGLTAIRVILRWTPDSSTALQIRLERQAESGAVFGRSAFVLYVFSTLLMTGAVTLVLPYIVPGAMCGTGVIQAMGVSGEYMVILRVMALVMLSLWRLANRLNHSDPRFPLEVDSGRLLLLALPLFFLSFWFTLQSVRQLGIPQVVDCCTAIYLSSDPTPDHPGWMSMADGFWMGSYLAGAILLMILGIRLSLWKKYVPPSWLTGMTAGITVGWIVVALRVLLYTLAPYHYGVLQHHCPWCLFLPVHYGIGFPLFGALAVVLMDGQAPLVIRWLLRHAPSVERVGINRVRRSGIRLAVAVFLFVAVSGLPAVIWRLRHGVWMDG